MKQCNFCENTSLTQKTTDYIYRHGEHFMLFKNVPAEICDYCGERYYEAKVLKAIEKEFFEVLNHRKKPTKNIVMPVEEYVAV